MNRKYALLVILVVIGALVVSAFSMVTINNQASLQRGHEADAARYTAMARYYEAQNLSALSADDVSAYRWQAMAGFYAAQQAQIPVTGGNLTTLSAADISAYRWQAMADFYTSQVSTAVRYGPPR